MSFVEKLVIFLVSMVLLGVVFSGLLIVKFTQDDISCSIVSKERVASENSSKYLIYCEDEVLENTDSFWGWKWNSSDFYRDLQEGQEYRLKVYGWRVPFFSMYRNILKIY